MKTFEELGVREDILRAITELGYVNPMPIQEKVIPHLLNGDNDIIGLAQTGTGKTAAFGLPVLQRIDVATEKPQALIIAPTRELHCYRLLRINKNPLHSERRIDWLCRLK